MHQVSHSLTRQSGAADEPAPISITSLSWNAGIALPKIARRYACVRLKSWIMLAWFCKLA